ncbi:molybdopterin-dependent oxidoreductase [Amycolatopsis endophytica]|uniref:DMSO/TMAO reductase YedYZ molybdopterin-dependent catalytic subunit n=1 Tax=Amycolatopsis endophytica TaxID=860233 RepID=A0A853AZ29_9PSEU|nr:molybdopterin-dependent oxidoreductase [Amycolatopsis endophytica]NYI88008.1 DMSO/TMAO reductase YedYZ molybdopterin-dependent catalytic subunit [Amycolatopsis endophytica]
MSTNLADAPPETPRLSAPVAGLIGVISLVAALGAGHLVAGFVGTNASPFFAVGNAAIDVTPGWLKDFAVRAFGTADKAVLLAGMAVVAVALAVGAGLASRRRPAPGLVFVGVVGVLGVVAVFTRPDLGQVAVLAPVVSLASGLAVFAWLHRSALDGQYSSTARRNFLIAVAGAGVAGVAGQLIGTSKDAEGSRAAVGRLVPARTAPPVPAGADFAKFGTPSFFTPNADFYRIDTAFVVPQVRTEDWSLRIHGMVDREVIYSWSDIRDRPLVERIVTLCCVSNPVGGPYISTARFVGVDLADLLDEAGVRTGAQQVFSTSEDGWTAGTPLSAMTDRSVGAMLAIGMNGEPLPIEHGFPARLVVPGLYGYVSATKWVRDLEVTTWDARTPYWLQRGWSEQAPIKTESRIDAPSGTVPAGQVRVAGIAWAQHTGIDRVEVSIDDGPWVPAELSTEVTVDAWRMWWADVTAGPGSHLVKVRATDRSGYTQTDQRADVVPDGATGWHTISFTAR